MKVQILLAELLNRNGISQRELSRKTGIRVASVNGMCKNEITQLPLDNLAKICEVLKCDIPDVLKLK